MYRRTRARATGVTVILPTSRARGSDGAWRAGTRETDALDPMALAGRVDSWFSRDARLRDGCSSVWHGARTPRLHAAHDVRIPTFPCNRSILRAAAATDIYPLLGGGGRSDRRFALGNEGAGYGASPSLTRAAPHARLQRWRVTVGAVVGLNAAGSRSFPAARVRVALEPDREFEAPPSPSYTSAIWPPAAARTPARVRDTTWPWLLRRRAQRHRAEACRDHSAACLPRARPAHTPFDCDIVFALSTAARPSRRADRELTGSGRRGDVVAGLSRVAVRAERRRWKKLSRDVRVLAGLHTIVAQAVLRALAERRTPALTDVRRPL